MREGIYRMVTLFVNYKLLFKKLIIQEDSAAVYVDLNVAVAPFYYKRYHLPTIVLLDFRRCPDGKVRISQQFDHHSLFMFYWVLGWPLTAAAEGIVRPLAGRTFAALGWAIDAVAEALEGWWGQRQQPPSTAFNKAAA
jgi:hypothetical protein